jgi:hypothetical protein
MTIEDLLHVFRFQLNKQSEEHVLKDTLDYWLFEGSDRIPGSVPVEDLATLIPLLENFQFEGYRLDVPMFIKPEAEY